MGARNRFIEHMTETDEDSNKTIVEAVALSVFPAFYLSDFFSSNLFPCYMTITFHTTK